MFEFAANITRDLHPISVHFPIGLLALSFGLSLASRGRPALNECSWIALILGGIAAIISVVTGLEAHEAYEQTPLIEYIKPHQMLGLFGAGGVWLVIAWRFVSRGKGVDAGRQPYYMAIAAAGLVWLVLLGGTGSNLVFSHGANVRGVNPLLAPAKPDDQFVPDTLP